MKEFSEIYSHAPKWRELVANRRNELEAKEVELSLESISIDIHNASWCPDCERETVELMALLEINSKKVEINIYSYEDIQSYKAKKAEGSLPVKCLPTFIFKRDGEELARVEESSGGELQEILNSL